MEEKIAIVAMEVMLEGAFGLDGFDRNLYDGILPSPADGTCVPPAGATESALGAAIAGALGDTLSRRGGNSPGTETPLVLACGPAPRATPRAGAELMPAWEHGAVFVEEDLFVALEKAISMLVEKGMESVVVAASGPCASPETAGTGANAAGTDGAGTAAHETGGRKACASCGDSRQGAAVVLKLLSGAKADKDRVYAVIDARDRLSAPLGVESGELFRQVFESFTPDPSEIGYLQICGKPLDELLQGPGLADIPAEGDSRLSCALTAGDAHWPHPGNLGSLLGIIQTSLCLYHRYLPGVPGWTPPEEFRRWEKSRFHIPARSRTWFLAGGAAKRRAALLCAGDGGLDHMILSEDPTLPFRSGKYLAQSSPFSFPIAGENEGELLTQLAQLEKALISEKGMAKLAQEAYGEFKNRDGAAYALMLIGGSIDELLREIRFVSKGIGRAFAAGTGRAAELRTPKGSFFTADPLGKEGKVVFVYPGVGSAYVGLGQDLFHMFPGVYDGFAQLAPDVGSFLKERELYPRRWAPITEEDQKGMDRVLRKEIMDISECGISFSVIFTMIMAGYFKLFPELAMGYSMGEASMMASLMVWQDPGKMSDRLKKCDVFSRALSGELTAVRKSWGLPDRGSEKEQIWESYTLLADRKEVAAAVADEERVYITLINTDSEVVIAGDPESCERVAKAVGCQYFPLRLPLAIHSQPAFTEYDNLVDLFTLDVGGKSGIRFYSSSCYLPVPIRSKSVAHSIARAFCDPVDFPRLVEKAYEDGGRIFIEMGARNICSLWINEILGGKPVAAVSLNQKGTSDQVSLVRGLAQLVGHRVKVDLAPLFKFGRGSKT